MRIAVVGAGVTGLAAAIRLAEAGCEVHVFEAAPFPGGRAGSFFDARIGGWVDHGPHLLIGAYRELSRLLEKSGAADQIHWQQSLKLDFWSESGGLRSLAPSPVLPIGPALALSLLRLPGHGLGSVAALIRLRRCLGAAPRTEPVRRWLDRIRPPETLTRELIEPLCLATMNASLAEANAASFAAVLDEAFSSHASARLGWFRAPLRKALIQPLAQYAERLGVRFHCRRRVDRAWLESPRIGGKRCARVVLALPAPSRERLLGRTRPESQRRWRGIANLHFWFREPLPWPSDTPLIGGLGTWVQWFIRVDAMHQSAPEGLTHIAAVISDARRLPEDPEKTALAELARMLGLPRTPQPWHHRRIWMKHATVLAENAARSPVLPPHVIDIGEDVAPGDLPATLETAARRSIGLERRIQQGMKVG